MNIKYRQLKAFTLAARHRSFAEAAEAMSVTPASFSTLIKELESDLGVSLFERTARRCVLTEAGRTFHERMDGALRHIEELYQELSDVGRGLLGRLTIATLPSLSFSVVAETLAMYRQAFPRVEIVLSERRNGEVIQAVRDHEVELGIGSLLQPDETLHWHPAWTDQVTLIVPAGHPLAQGRVNWRALEHYPFITMSTGPVDHAMRALDLHIHPLFEVDHVATAVAMVRRNIGITAIPSGVIPALNMDGVVCVPISGRYTTRTLGVIYRRSAPLSQAAAHFMSQLCSLSDEAIRKVALQPVRAAPVRSRRATTPRPRT